MKHTTYVEYRAGIAYITTELAADLCGVSPQTFAGWRHKPDPPPYDRGSRSVPLIELGHWIREHQVMKRGTGGHGYPYLPNADQLTGGEKMPGLPDKESHEARLKRLQADKLQIEIDVQTKKLIPVDEVQQTWSVIATRVKTRLLRLPVALAPLVTGLSDVYAVQEKLTEGVNEALEALADGGEDDGSSIAGGSIPDTD